jgi:hypothetical protein
MNRDYSHGFGCWVTHDEMASLLTIFYETDSFEYADDLARPKRGKARHPAT